MTPDAGDSRTYAVGIFAKRVTKEELLERHCGLRIADCGLRLEAQRARTQAADRPGGDFEHEDAFSVHPALGVDRTVAQAERGGGAADTADDGALHVVGCGRGREIDRLLEERAVQRIGLVEDRERVQPAAGQQPFERVLTAGNESFDERRRVRLVPLGAARPAAA